MIPTKHICTACNYIYDEILGDAKAKVLSGTKFANLASDWQCPGCGQNKEFFVNCTCVSISKHQEESCIKNAYLDSLNIIV